jgi:hypothetical protein
MSRRGEVLEGRRGEALEGKRGSLGPVVLSAADVVVPRCRIRVLDSGIERELIQWWLRRGTGIRPRGDRRVRVSRVCGSQVLFVTPGDYARTSWKGPAC